MVINNIAGCCPIGASCGGSSSVLSQKATTAAATKAAATTSRGAQTSAAAQAQNGCASGFISCNDGTGGCCPSGSQVFSSWMVVVNEVVRG